MSNRFRAFIYLRLSDDDGTGKESNSIGNQRKLIESFLKDHPEIEFVEEFVDDGHSGVTVDRPAFQEMLQRLEDGDANCLIVKDASRFARNSIDANSYMQRIFPMMKVRFIAINDNYDSFNEQPGDDMTLSFHNMINEIYSREQSVKVKRILNEKVERGEFIGAFAPYGYLKDPKNKNHLIIDEETAPVVRKIYQMCIDGVATQQIAKILNKECILNPTMYKRTVQMLNYTSPNKLQKTTYWSASTVKSILTNHTYAGHLEQHKKTQKYKMSKSYRALPKEKHTIVRNTHKGIVNDKEFETAQDMLKSRRREFSTNEDNPDMYSGLLKCGDCGRVIQLRRSKKNKYLYYKCSTYTRISMSLCTSHTIRKDILDSIVTDELNKHLNVGMDEVAFGNIKTSLIRQQKKKIDAEVVKCQNQIEKNNIKILALTDKLAEGILSNDAYQYSVSKYQQDIEKLQQRKISLEEQQKDKKSQMIALGEWMSTFERYKNIETLDRDILTSLIKEIRVFEDHRLEIDFRFRNPFDNKTHSNIDIEERKSVNQ